MKTEALPKDDNVEKAVPEENKHNNGEKRENAFSNEQPHPVPEKDQNTEAIATINLAKTEEVNQKDLPQENQESTKQEVNQQSKKDKKKRKIAKQQTNEF